MGPALLHREESVDNVKVKKKQYIEQAQQPPHEEEQERGSDTDINLSVVFQNKVQEGITFNILVLVEATGTFIGEYSAPIDAIRASTRCTEMDMETNTGTDHSRIIMLVPGMDIAHRAKENHHEHNAGTRGRQL